MAKQVTALAQWHGSYRMGAERVGALLDGCEWVGIPFAGGMCEIAHIKARTIVANDLHLGIISLAQCVADPEVLPNLQAELRDRLVHPRTLAAAQSAFPQAVDNFSRALSYFVIAWMTRSGTAGTDRERTGKLCLRWEAGGGDSAKRYHSAIDALPQWAEHFKRCTFSTLDAFDFLAQCKDRPKHGIYCDPPFLGAGGKKYSHNCGHTEAQQIEWHHDLRDYLTEFVETKVLVRCYDVPLMRELYDAPHWRWSEFSGRKQTNASAPEVLITNWEPQP